MSELNTNVFSFEYETVAKRRCELSTNLVVNLLLPYLYNGNYVLKILRIKQNDNNK